MPLTSAHALDFLKTVRPWNELSVPDLNAVLAEFSSHTVRQDDVIVAVGDENNSLYLIRSGAVELRDAQGTLAGRRQEGETFGFVSLVKNAAATQHITACEPSELWQLPGETFHALCHDHPPLRDYFLLVEAQRLHRALVQLRESTVGESLDPIMPVSELCDAPPVIVSVDHSIVDTARLMTEAHQSCALVVDARGALTGIVTDSDLRTRVLVPQRDAWQPVSAIMSANPAKVDVEKTAFDTHLAMLQHSVQHMPVVQAGQPVGLINASDLLRQHRIGSVQINTAIYRANALPALVEDSKQLPAVFERLLASGLDAWQVGQFMSSISENLTARVLQLAEAELGAPPVSYAWLTAGSLGRREQLLQSDQDNALLLDDAFDETHHARYFDDLATYVCDALDACGYEYCTGDFMASNARWRQPLAVWQSYFERWMSRPRSEQLHECSVWLDARVLYGDESLLQRLRDSYAQHMRSNPMFLGYLFANTMQHTPPLGFFRQLVLLNDEHHRNRLNLKNRGTGPIVDMARSMAASIGVNANNTRNRLMQCVDAQALNADDADNLLDAFGFINHVRLHHQAAQLAAGTTPDNMADPAELSSFEREHLRDAFVVVSGLQKAFARRYSIHLPR